MFGFLHGPRHHQRYRQIYASCCSSLRDRYGYRALPFVSYEAVFARLIATDCGLLPQPDPDAVTCCKTRRRYSGVRSDRPAALIATCEFTSAFAMLLADIKLADDVQDERSALAFFGRRIFGKRFTRARDYFESHHPGFGSELGRILQRHAHMERSGKRIHIDRYGAPTGEAFAMVFGILPQVIATADGNTANGNAADGQLVDSFRRCGELVGRALIAFDCAVDYESDRKRGSYTPLAGNQDVAAAFDASARTLVELGWHLGSIVPFDSDRPGISQAVLQHRIDAIGFRKRQRISVRQGSSRKGRRRSDGARSIGGLVLAPPSPRGGFCDCDCVCGGCDGCVAGIGHLGDCCRLPSFGCDACCECCGLTVCDSKTSKTKDSVATDSSGADRAPRLAEVVVALAPYGTVRRIDETVAGDGASGAIEEPAKCEGGMIDAGEKVVIVRKEAFGLLVRRIREKTGSSDEPPAT